MLLIPAALLFAVPTTKLSNGVDMPMLILGTGTSTWRNDTSTAATVKMGLLAGSGLSECIHVAVAGHRLMPV